MKKTPSLPRIVPFIPRRKARGPRLQQCVLNYIRAHPEHWDQSSWNCGTAFCFAGIASCMCGIPVPTIASIQTSRGLNRHFQWRAQISKALGIPAADEWTFFHPGNSFSALCEAVRDFRGGKHGTL